jgi:riboflavin kinase/FMN adenylyltransferase
VKFTDGIHLGHRQVIATCISEAKRQRLKSIVFSFQPHPAMVLSGRSSPLISSYEERVELLARYGFDYILMQKFDLDFSHLSAEYFLDEILVKQLSARTVVVGRKFHFGHKALGNISSLRSDGRFDVVECPDFQTNGITVSSSSIRKALEAANLSWAEEALGYPYFAGGTVIEGDQRGRSIGFPTANIEPTKELILPFGVYACVVVDQKSQNIFSGICNWGSRPTFSKESSLLEVFLFDFSDDLYGRDLRLFFLDRVRSEKKFEGPDQLKAQIDLDVKKVHEVLTARNLFHRKKSDSRWNLSRPDPELQWFQPLATATRSTASD